MTDEKKDQPTGFVNHIRPNNTGIYDEPLRNGMFSVLNVLLNQPEVTEKAIPKILLKPKFWKVH